MAKALPGMQGGSIDFSEDLAYPSVSKKQTFVKKCLMKQVCEMPKRPRAHQLETLSRTAFERSLPRSALFRTVAPDYGVDGIVEVFGDGGSATGDFFLVQLKSTDQENLTDALAITLKADTAKYYHNLVLPVLIVLYHAPSEQIYAKWYKRPEANGQQSTITFRLLVNDLWTTDRWNEVLSNLLAARVLHSEAKRREAIAAYYVDKFAVDLSTKAIPSVSTINFSDLKAGTHVIHSVFGKGIVTDISQFYLFVKFESDDMDRQFNSGDLDEFTTP